MDYSPWNQKDKFWERWPDNCEEIDALRPAEVRNAPLNKRQNDRDITRDILDSASFASFPCEATDVDDPEIQWALYERFKDEQQA